jgi:hypothetical protein
MPEPNDGRIYIAQAVCSNHHPHYLLLGRYETSEIAVEQLGNLMALHVMELRQRNLLLDKCPVCGDAAEDWTLEIGLTTWKTVQEAQQALSGGGLEADLERQAFDRAMRN